ncbi:hypothetical protein [uncultured Roseobacter sp.]|uniref:hypothetical protein n=1 Tax=uncultured Roseobacter sp. TaxID=114847 RepID=UPI00261B1575|nr:hypothetical protein [uncultured Roseobacter sp.]
MHDFISRCVLILAILVPFSVFAEPRIMVSQFNPVSPPENLADAVADCRNDELCKAATDAVAAYFNVASAKMEKAEHVISKFETGEGSEEVRVIIEPPRGYKVCGRRCAC